MKRQKKVWLTVEPSGAVSLDCYGDLEVSTKLQIEKELLKDGEYHFGDHRVVPAGE